MKVVDALQQRNLNALSSLGEEILQQPMDEVPPMAVLCAMASVGVHQPKPGQGVQESQRNFREVVQSVEDLEVALSSDWPLWSLLHLYSSASGHSGFQQQLYTQQTGR